MFFQRFDFGFEARGNRGRREFHAYHAGHPQQVSLFGSQPLDLPRDQVLQIVRHPGLEGSGANLEE